MSGADSSPMGSLGPHKNIPCSGNPPRDSTGTSQSGWSQVTERPGSRVPVTVGAADHTVNQEERSQGGTRESFQQAPSRQGCGQLLTASS